MVEIDCSVLKKTYSDIVDNLNTGFEDRFGTEDVSPEIAKHATDPGAVRDQIGVMNDLTNQIVNDCHTDEGVLHEVYGSLNQNVVDSIGIYSNENLKEIPEFGELSFIISAVAFGGFVFVMKRHEIVGALRKLFRK